jgi:hypothetical protein
MPQVPPLEAELLELDAPELDDADDDEDSPLPELLPELLLASPVVLV